eukprot:jgi/Chrzof1/12754/Cz07g06100.t1
MLYATHVSGQQVSKLTVSIGNSVVSDLAETEPKEEDKGGKLGATPNATGCTLMGIEDWHVLWHGRVVKPHPNPSVFILWHGVWRPTCLLRL